MKIFQKISLNKIVCSLSLYVVLICVACGGASQPGVGGKSTESTESTDLSTTEMVGPEGATLTNGYLTLDFTEGAVSEDTKITMTPVETSDGIRWDFGPAGTKFDGDVWAYFVVTEDEFREAMGEYVDEEGNDVDLLEMGMPLMVPSLESEDGSFEILDYTLSRLEDGAKHENPVVQALIDDAPEGDKIVIAAKIQHFSIFRIRVFRHKPKSPDGKASEYIALDNSLEGPEEKEVNSPPFEYTYTLDKSNQKIIKKAKKKSSDSDGKDEKTDDSKDDSKDETKKEEEKPKTTDIITHEFYSKPEFTWKKANYAVKGKGSLVTKSEVALNEVIYSSSSDWPKVKCGSEEGKFTVKAKATVNVRYGIVGAIHLTNKLVTLETSSVTECIAAEEDDYDYNSDPDNDEYSVPGGDEGLESGEESVGANPFDGFDGQSFVAAGDGCVYVEYFTVATYEDGTVLSTGDTDIAFGLDGTATGVELFGQPYDLEMTINELNGLDITYTNDDGSCGQSFEKEEEGFIQIG